MTDTPTPDTPDPTPPAEADERVGLDLALSDLLATTDLGVERQVTSFLELIAAALNIPGSAPLPRGVDPDEDPEQGKLPYRVVDGQGQGWHLGGVAMTEDIKRGIDTGDKDTVVYGADYGFKRGLEEGVSLAWIEAERGPVRQVTWPTRMESWALEAAIRAAGRKAAATVAVALYSAWRRTRELPHPKQFLLGAGREGSWETEKLRSIVLYPGSDLAERPKRFNPVCVEVIEQVITGWVTSEDRFVEVAETLAHAFGGAADLLYRRAVAQAPSGQKARYAWYYVADQYLQPETRMVNYGWLLHGLLMSTAVNADHTLHWLGEQ